MPNVRVAALCDADERLFPAAVAEVEKLPATARHRVRYSPPAGREDIDAVSMQRRITGTL